MEGWHVSVKVTLEGQMSNPFPLQPVHYPPFLVEWCVRWSCNLDIACSILDQVDIYIYLFSFIL